MTSIILAQATVEYGAIAGVSTRFASVFNRIEASFYENQPTWFIVGAVILVMLVWRRN